MSDLIRREDAIEALDFEIVHMTAYTIDGKNEGNPLAQYNKGLEDGIKAIKALPSAEPEQKWIPVSEALPENGHAVLCTVKGYPEGENWTIADCRYKDGVWEICEEAAYDYWTELSDVLAWMPLPEPWRGEDENA